MGTSVFCIANIIRASASRYNPLWGVNKLRAMKLPLGWGISQEIVIVDGSSYQIYRANMQSLFSEMGAGMQIW